MKKFIALVLSLIMALSLCAPAWAAGEVVVANTAALQDALYNAADGTTIQLKAGVNYGTVVFGQNADSKVVDITDMGGDAAGNEHYSKYENITILGAEGATVDQIDFKVGWIDGHEGASYVDIKNLTVQGVTFSGEKTAFNMEGSKGGGLGIDGLNIIGCKMNDADGDDRFVFQQITGYKEQSDKTTNEYVMTTGVKNLTITGCVVEGAYQVIESRAMENLTITNNTFKGIKARDMLITSDVTNHPNATYTGTITITGNTSIGGEERFVRASLNNSDATLIIKDNTINNYMGEDDDYIKVDGIADGNTKVTIANNTLVTVAKVGDVEYTTLAEAVAVGGNIVLTNDAIISESLPVTKDTVLDLNGKNIGTSGSTTGSPLYLQGGKLTVKNGTLDLDGTHTNVNGTFSVAIGYDAQTELVVENVNFTGTTAINGTFATDGPLKIAISDCTMDVTNLGIAVSANSTEAIATINNCNIDADVYAIFASQGSKITINGGTYKSAGKVITSMYDNTVVTINGGTFDGELWVTDGGSLVIYGGTFSVDPTPYVADGCYVTEADGKYVVAVKKVEADKVDTEVKVDVATPEVSVNAENMKPAEEQIANEIAAVEELVKGDEVAEEILESAVPEVTVKAEDVAEALAKENVVVANEDVNVFVQPYYDVVIEAVSVEDGKASVTFDITPMYKVVATTADTAAEIDLDGAGKNAVVVGDPAKMTVTETVKLTIAIPEALANIAANNGNKLYVTHDKGENGPKYVYEADVDVAAKTATFENPNGFSTFTLSTENNTVAVVGDMNYATLQGAIDNAGKGAVIEVKVSGLEADINAPCSFKLQLAGNITEPTFNVAKGYTMSKWYVNGVYTYIVQSASAGGYAPVAPSTPEKVVTSADTFDAGIALYVGMSVMAAAGSAVVLKKRED